jgi:antitoxin component YwqK of YwqJK toxin-antitoxin module
MIRILLFTSLSLLLAFACTTPEVKSPEMDNYDLIPTNDPDRFEAHLKNIEDEVIEKGFFYKGLKDGTWVKYDANGDKISEISGYHAGKLDGISIKLDPRGQLQERKEYRDNRLHGYYALYQYGKLLKEANYKDGQLHGRMTKYVEFTGKKLSEADYKNGKQDGIFRYFDDKGNITLEYRYKNGEKITSEE